MTRAEEVLSAIIRVLDERDPLLSDRERQAMIEGITNLLLSQPVPENVDIEEFARRLAANMDALGEDASPD